MAVKRKRKDYEVTSLVVCDDARQEISGKWILIGVYNEAIIVKQFPARILRLVFRVTANVTQVANEVLFKLVQKDGSEKGRGKMLLEGTKAGQVVFNFDIRNLTFNHEDTFRICFGIDEEPKSIGVFSVRGPKTEDEKERLLNVS